MTRSIVILAAGVGGEAVSAVQGVEKLGIIGVLIIAIYVIYRDGVKRQDKLEAIIAANTAALTKNSDASLTTTESMKEVTAAIKSCRDREMGVLQGIKNIARIQGEEETRQGR